MNNTVSVKNTNKSLSAKIKEFFQLLFINLVVSKRNLVEFVKVVFKYYKNITFCKEDISLILMYLFDNPFSISKRFLKNQKAEDIYTYGETPLTTMEMIAKKCQIQSTDCVYELGSGRGRTCFWLNSIIGCQVVGIEYVPEFVQRAQRIQRKLKIDGVQFKLGDFTEMNLSQATVIYLYGTCLSNDQISHLVANLRKVPSGTKIITVSYPLTDYVDEPLFEVMQCFSASFTWGQADVYIHVRK